MGRWGQRRLKSVFSREGARQAVARLEAELKRAYLLMPGPTMLAGGAR
jgi:hypothetical protein